MSAEAVRFDEKLRSSTSDRMVPTGNVVRVMRRVAESAGLDVTAELYNEALRHAAEGHLAAAREQLTMLTVLAPDDGDARLALAKVEVSSQNWTAALKALDEARAHGVSVPPGLRRAVEEHLRAESAAENEQLAAVRAREQGEIKALRQEARRLRSESALAATQLQAAEIQQKRWAWVASGTAVFSMFLLVAVMLFGGKPVAADGAAVGKVVAPSEAAAVAEAAPEAKAPVAPKVEVDPTQAAVSAVAALPWIKDGSLSVVSDNGTVTLTGTVDSAKQLAEARRVLGKLSGVHTVDTAQVTNLARTHGTTHVVRPGDHLGKISSEYYGGVSYGEKILKANKATLKSANAMQVGQKLIIPRVE